MIWARMKALLMAVLLPQSSPAAFHLFLIMGLGLKSWLPKTPYWFWPPSATASFCNVLCYFARYYYALYRLPCECLTLNSPLLCVVLQCSISIELYSPVFFSHSTVFLFVLPCNALYCSCVVVLYIWIFISNVWACCTAALIACMDCYRRLSCLIWTCIVFCNVELCIWICIGLYSHVLFFSCGVLFLI